MADYEKAIKHFRSGEGLDEAALLIQQVTDPMAFLNLDNPPKPDHAVQVGVRVLLDAIKRKAKES